MEDKESWLQRTWRPMMGWTYMVTCIFDFIIGPVYYNVLQYMNPGQHISMWQAITLQGGGLYHLAMGAILGISAYGRTQEKINPPTSTYSLPEPSYTPQPYSQSYSQSYSQPYSQPYTPPPAQEYAESEYAPPVKVRRSYAKKPAQKPDELL